jgi:hypothetical protein
MTTTFPAPVFDHLLRLTDRRGTFGHARLAEPLPEHGYCTDDVARVLVVATRDHGPDRTLNGLAGVALRFLNDAQALTGACRNEMDSMGSWVDEPALDDAWGLCIWGLGTAAAHSNVSWARQSAIMQFERAAQEQSAWPRAMAFAALGAAELLAFDPEHRAARALLTDLRHLGSRSELRPDVALARVATDVRERCPAGGDDRCRSRARRRAAAAARTGSVGVANRVRNGRRASVADPRCGQRSPGREAWFSPAAYRGIHTRRCVRPPPPSTRTRSGSPASGPRPPGSWATTTRESRCGTRIRVADNRDCAPTG